MAETSLGFAELDGLAIQIANECRTAALSEKYYARRLERAKRWSTTIDVVLAVLSPTSVIAGWAIWRGPEGNRVWQVLLGTVALLNLVKPFLRLPERIDRNAKLSAAYHELFVEQKDLADELRIHHDLDEPLLETQRKLHARSLELEKQDDVAVDTALRDACEREVREQYPDEYFWRPARPELALQPGRPWGEPPPRAPARAPLDGPRRAP